MNNELYTKIITDIISQQESIIGPVAISRASTIRGLVLDWTHGHGVQISGDPREVIDSLVADYSVLFGELSVEVCKEAAAKYTDQLMPEQLPSTLR
jgi:hypothetical protein